MRGCIIPTMPLNHIPPAKSFSDVVSGFAQLRPPPTVPLSPLAPSPQHVGAGEGRAVIDGLQRAHHLPAQPLAPGGLVTAHLLAHCGAERVVGRIQRRMQEV